MVGDTSSNNAAVSPEHQASKSGPRSLGQLVTTALKRLHFWGALLGLDPLRLIRVLADSPAFIRDLVRFRSQDLASRSRFLLHPCVGEGRKPSGIAKGHYFHQDLLVARRIFESSPDRHLDVGSRLDGFVAHVAVFRNLEIGDVRPLGSPIPRVTFIRLDAMKGAPANLEGRFDSVSCLHAIEHFGLGRYGDEIDPQGHRKGLKTLASLLRPSGTLYLSVPIGPTRTEFNAHRVFSVQDLLAWIDEEFFVERFSYVDDSGDLYEDVAIGHGKATNFGCWYGCAILELKKR